MMKKVMKNHIKIIKKKKIKNYLEKKKVMKKIIKNTKRKGY